MKKTQRIAIFASHNASSLDGVYGACIKNEINASIELIITNNTNANVLNKANKYNIDSYVINSSNSDDIDFDVLSYLKKYDIDYIILMGYMKKISSILTSKYKIINTHPSLLPKYGGVGMYGRFVHEAVIKNNETQSGISIHFVNENYDEGEIILQEKISLDKNENIDSLESKIKELEQKSIITALKICLK